MHFESLATYIIVQHAVIISDAIPQVGLEWMNLSITIINLRKGKLGTTQYGFNQLQKNTRT
jgi:hypothetical protein